MTNVSALHSAPAGTATIGAHADRDRLSRMGGRIYTAFGWIVVCAATTFGLWFLLWKVDKLESPVLTLMPQPTIANARVQLNTPGYALTADLASYDDELFAFLMFDYFRHDRGLAGMELLLTYDRSRTDHRYRLVLRGQDDLLQAMSSLAAVQVVRAAGSGAWSLTPTSHVMDFQDQTTLFVSAYNLPVRGKMEALDRPALAQYLRRFIRFKSNTDPRIRRKLEPVPKPLSRDEAQRLAEDVITVAEFYSLPLELLLGIGAMENNYMDVRGDLTHTVWKRKPAPDDIVLERRGGRSRILNDSAGVWQITRETLRYAHKLYRKDKRDYSLLPQHLRPSETLRMSDISPLVLTTYAGLLLRDLLDFFEGDPTLAVSAYNGGPARPNLRYGAGVNRVASHVRRVLEQSAALKGKTVVNTTWIRAR